MARFGNWTVDEEGIKWDGPNNYFIEREVINEAGPADRANKYDWMLHITEKTWASDSDISDFNEAFKYALNLYGIETPKGISYEKTVVEQMRLLKQR